MMQIGERAALLHRSVQMDLYLLLEQPIVYPALLAFRSIHRVAAKTFDMNGHAIELFEDALDVSVLHAALEIEKKTVVARIRAQRHGGDESP